MADALHDSELRRVISEVLASAVSAEREACASLVEPKASRPCDCTSCYCDNPGDLRDVIDWDTATYLAAQIRARS